MTTTDLTTNIRTVRDLLKRNAPKIEAVLPKHLDADRLMQIAATVVQRTPALAECSPRSLLGACIQSAQVGLNLDPTLGEAYLVPYYHKASREKRAQFQVGYRGLIRLARNSGDVSSVFAMPVYKGEDYSEEITHNGPTFKHVPGEGPYGRDQLRCVYMVCKFLTGGFHWGRMWSWEIDLIRDRSKAGQSGPWVTDYIEMAKKTVVRREAKYLPLSTDAQRVIADDERIDLGIETANVIDLEGGERPAPDDEPIEKTNDPNPEAQKQLDDLKASLDGVQAPIDIPDIEQPSPTPNPVLAKREPKEERGCGECGLINNVPVSRDTFECEGCGNVTVQAPKN